MVERVATHRQNYAARLVSASALEFLIDVSTMRWWDVCVVKTLALARKLDSRSSHSRVRARAR